ncbi:hypothetical protein Pint_04462 [Pistacia integerrima]|uniref:Uncharacterized protein n=1 Tax=Pistacia integerrima TaxID=434235 RepID=A0ACC0Z642_9ROSI|nr:hypothetical protein Pint_04462 [Pistacia integerrima]
MKAIKASLEDISFLLRIPQRKPYGTMEGNVKKALKIAMDEKDSILASIPMDLKEKGSELYASLIHGKGGLQALLNCIKDQDPDKRRGTVELTIEIGDGSSFSPEAGVNRGKPPQSRLSVKFIYILITVLFSHLDSFFYHQDHLLSCSRWIFSIAKLVIDGAYDRTRLSCIEKAILTDSGLDKNSGDSVPLEIKPSGQFEPLYKTTLNGELLVLPLSVYGAVAMAHSEVSEEYSAPYQFFFYPYDKRNGGFPSIQVMTYTVFFCWLVCCLWRGGGRGGWFVCV